ncbi:uncharacterized protein LOC115214126 [Argonauta hians]
MATSWIFLMLGLSFTLTTVCGYVPPSPRDVYHKRSRLKISQRNNGGGAAGRNDPGIEGTLKLNEGRRHLKPKPPGKGKDTHKAIMTRKVFIPDAQKCCRVGKKVARRKLMCSMHIHLTNSDSNSSYRSSDHRKRQYLGKLFPKLGRCAARFTSRFEKCCKTRQEHMQRMKKFCKSRKNYRKRKCRRYQK